MNNKLGMKFWILPIIGGICGIIIGPMYYAYMLYPNSINNVLISIGSNPQVITNIGVVLSIVYFVGLPIILSKKNRV